MKPGSLKILAISGVLIVALAFAGVAIAQGMHHHGGPMGDFGFGFGDHMLGYFTDVLDLSHQFVGELETRAGGRDVVHAARQIVTDRPTAARRVATSASTRWCAVDPGYRHSGG